MSDLFDWLADPEGMDRAEKIERDRKRKSLLSVGPALVTSTKVIHRGLYQRVYGDKGGQRRVASMCPNQGGYLPVGSFTRSNKYNYKGNDSYSTLADAAEYGDKLCEHCFSEEGHNSQIDLWIRNWDCELKSFVRSLQKVQSVKFADENQTNNFLF